MLIKFKKVSDDINACQSSCKEINKTLSDEIRTLCNIENNTSKISEKLGDIDDVSNKINSLECNYLKKIKAKTDNLDGFQSKVIDPLSRLTESINELKAIKEPIL